MSRPSRQETRIRRGREADAAFERIRAEAYARVLGVCTECGGPVEDHADACSRTA